MLDKHLDKPIPAPPSSLKSSSPAPKNSRLGVIRMEPWSWEEIVAARELCVEKVNQHRCWHIFWLARLEGQSAPMLVYILAHRARRSISTDVGIYLARRAIWTCILMAN